VKRALFLDRDGVVNHDLGYVHRMEQFEFVEGIFDLCRAARARSMALVVVTNQAGIGRGYYGEAEFERLTAWMCGRFADEGVPIERVYHCPFHPEHGIGGYRLDSFDRKPNPGMLLRAGKDLGLRLEDSVMVGDTQSDMLAAQRAGLAVRCLYAPDADPADGPDGAATHVVHALRDAVPLLGPLA